MYAAFPSSNSLAFPDWILFRASNMNMERMKKRAYAIHAFSEFWGCSQILMHCTRRSHASLSIAQRRLDSYIGLAIQLSEFTEESARVFIHWLYSYDYHRRRLWRLWKEYPPPPAYFFQYIQTRHINKHILLANFTLIACWGLFVWNDRKSFVPL